MILGVGLYDGNEWRGLASEWRGGAVVFVGLQEGFVGFNPLGRSGSGKLEKQPLVGVFG